MSELVPFDVVDGVGRLQLNRPEMANSFDLPTARAFAAVVARARNDEAVRSVLLTGAGARFCAGGDVASFAAASDQGAYLHELALELGAAVHALELIEKPVVAAVHGAVAGAGLALMLSCDVVIAQESTKFAFAYPGIGLTPDCGLSNLLPRAVGQQRALGFALGGGKAIDGATALGCGLVTEVTGDARSRAEELAKSLAAGPAAALGQARRLLREGWNLDRASMGVKEARTISAMVHGSEAQELIIRFVSG